MKPSDETIQALDGVSTEVGANRVLIPRSEAERAYNQGIELAMKFCAVYMEGGGLFQSEAIKEKAATSHG